MPERDRTVNGLLGTADDDTMTLDQHMLVCELCSSADDACDVGQRIAAREWETEHEGGNE